jgi:hypothetical protein
MKKEQEMVKSLKDIQKQGKKIRLDVWLLTQPGSTKRGVARGNFSLPLYVYVS